MTQILFLVSFIFSIAGARAEEISTSSPVVPQASPAPPSEQAPSPSPTAPVVRPQAAAEGPKLKPAVDSVVLAIVDPIERSEFESRILPNIRTNLSACRHCEVLNVTPYDGQGQFSPTALLAQLDRVPKKDAVLVFLWNRKFKKGEDDALVEKVRGLLKSGVVVVASAGRPGASEATLMISRTLWGQIPEVLIVGELEAAERLAQGTFFGPELITALRPVVGFEGTDRGALPFGIRIASQFKTRQPLQWQSSLRDRKSKLRAFWPTLRDFFGER